MYRNVYNAHYRPATGAWSSTRVTDERRAPPSPSAAAARAPWADDIDEIRDLLRQILNQRPPTNYDTDFPPLNRQQQQQQQQPDVRAAPIPTHLRPTTSNHQPRPQQPNQPRPPRPQTSTTSNNPPTNNPNQQTRPIPVSDLDMHTPPDFRNGSRISNLHPTLSRQDRSTSNRRRDNRQDRTHNNDNQQQRPSRLQDRLFRYVQIGHHLRNWDRLPKQLDSRLQDFVNDIKPPLSNATLFDALNRSTINYSNCITLKVREHLLFQKGEIEKELRDLSATPDDVSCAAANVVQTLRQRFNKVTAFHHKLLNSAKGIVGVGFHSRADISTVNITDSIDVVALSQSVDVVAPTPPSAVRIGTGDSADHAADGAAGEGGDDNPTTVYNVPVSNSFSLLTQTNFQSPLKRKRTTTPPSTSPPTDAATAPKRLFTEPACPLNTNRDPRIRLQPLTVDVNQSVHLSPSPTRPAPRSTDNRPLGARELARATTVESTLNQTTVSSKPRLTKVIDPINVKLDFNSNVNTLLIGSSNLSRVSAPSLPNDWHVISVPGATIQYITSIIEELPTLPELENIIISCGLNNRQDVNTPPIVECFEAAGRLKVKVFFNAISFQESSMTEREYTTLECINCIACDYHNVIYIPPLQQSDIQMLPDSPVHYDDLTLAKIVENIIANVRDFC